MVLNHMDSLENFLWDCYVKSFENADCMIEATSDLSREEKTNMMCLSEKSYTIWSDVYKKIVDYLSDHVRIQSRGIKRAPVRVEFHPKFGWTIVAGDAYAYLGKSSVYGNLKCTIGENTYFSGHSVIRGNGCFEIGQYSSVGFNLYANVSNQNKAIQYPASIGLFTESRIIDRHLFDGCNSKIKIKSSMNTNNSIVIGNDVWIGQSTTIFTNVNIADGAVIGAHSLVTKDCEPYGVYVGKPARLIRYRFSHDIIEQLLEVKWWNWSNDRIRRNHIFFGTDLNAYSDCISDIINE